MSDKAILVGKEVVPCDDLLKWGEWFQNPLNRIVARTILNQRKRIWVSTVFLGIDHSFGFGKPLWFETMIFGTSINEKQARYHDYDSALKGHQKMVKSAVQARQIRSDRLDLAKSLKKLRKLTRNG